MEFNGREINPWMISTIILIILVMISLTNIGYKYGYNDGKEEGKWETINLIEMSGSIPIHTPNNTIFNKDISWIPLQIICGGSQ